MITYYNLGSGSKGNCSLIEFEDQVIMIDAGFSRKEICRRMDELGIDRSKIQAILITHEHTDHINGLKVFSSNHKKAQCFMNSATAERLHHMDKLPQDDQLVLFNNGTPFEIGSFKIEAFSISHDAADPVGYIIHVAGRKLGICTDLGFYGRMVPLKLQQSDFLVLECNHCPNLVRASTRPPATQKRIMGRRGHLSNDQCNELMRELYHDGIQHVVLAHLSKECNEELLVEKQFTSTLFNLGAKEKTHFTIAKQHEACDPISIL